MDYLRKSGRKSLQKYAVQESHQYYQRAFQILGQTLGDSEEEKWLLIDFLNEWARVFYYRADFAGFTRLFLEHQELAESLSDKALLGIFYGWLCIYLVLYRQGERILPILTLRPWKWARDRE